MSFEHGIIQTTNLSEEEHRRIVSELRAFFPDAEDGGQTIMLSQTAPICVEVIASWENWEIGFKVSALAILATYGKKLVENAADATPNKIQGFIDVLRRLAERLGQSLILTPKIPGPGVHITRIILPAHDRKRRLRDLALFASYISGIRRAIDGLNADDIGGEVTVRISDDSFRLEWLSSSGFEVYRQVFDPEGKPQTDPQLVKKPIE